MTRELVDRLTQGFFVFWTLAAWAAHFFGVGWSYVHLDIAVILTVASTIAVGAIEFDIRDSRKWGNKK